MSKLEHSEGRTPGLLTHFKAAAVAAALVPLASFAATPAAAQPCFGYITGYVWYDANQNGIQDDGEQPIEGVVVSAKAGEGNELVTETAKTGDALQPGQYSICLSYETTEQWDVSATLPAGFDFVLANQGGNDAKDSDGENINPGGGDIQPSIFTTVPPNSDVDFGFWKPATQSYPGTGTPGYWKNHPEAWPVADIKIGNTIFTK